MATGSELYLASKVDRIDTIYKNESSPFSSWNLDPSLEPGRTLRHEDGYYSRSRYDRYSDGSHNILGEILRSILNLQSY